MLRVGEGVLRTLGSDSRPSRRRSNEKPGPTSLAGLEACPKLTDVVVTEKAFPEAEVKAPDAVLKKRSEYGGVDER